MKFHNYYIIFPFSSFLTWQWVIYKCNLRIIIFTYWCWSHTVSRFCASSFTSDQSLWALTSISVTQDSSITFLATSYDTISTRWSSDWRHKDDSNCSCFAFDICVSCIWIYPTFSVRQIPREVAVWTIISIYNL